MHRIITSVALLVLAATVGLTGCVTVSPPAPSGAGAPQIVQAPAGEALERLMRSRSTPPKERRPARSKTVPPRAPAPRRVPRYVPLPQLPAVPPQAPAVRPARSPGTDLRQRQSCTIRRDFDQGQSGSHRLDLC